MCRLRHRRELELWLADLSVLFFGFSACRGVFECLFGNRRKRQLSFDGCGGCSGALGLAGEEGNFEGEDGVYFRVLGKAVHFCGLEDDDEFVVLG